MVDRLTRRSQQIATFPLSGRIVPEANDVNIREILEGPYRIIYHLLEDEIEYHRCGAWSAAVAGRTIALSSECSRQTPPNQRHARERAQRSSYVYFQYRPRAL